jgi:hypothetical protein
MQQQNENFRQITKNIHFPEKGFSFLTFQDKLAITAVSAQLCPLGHP